MAEKPISITLTPGPNGTYQVGGLTAAPSASGNPFEAGASNTSMVPAGQAQMTGYRAQLPNGQWISFASEADYLKADAYVRSWMQQNQGQPVLGGGVPVERGKAAFEQQDRLLPAAFA